MVASVSDTVSTPDPAIDRSISERKRRANRRNARKSTGPVTDEGKARASQNALRHGLRCTDRVILPGEKMGEYLLVLHGLIDSHRPQNAMEMLLVERIALAQWKLMRLQKLEQTRHAQTMAGLRGAAVEQIDTLQRRDRAAGLAPRFAEHFQEMEQQALSSWSSPSESLAPEIVQAAQLGQEKGFEEFERLHRYEQRLESSILRCTRELSRVQEARRKRHLLGESNYLSPYQAELQDVLSHIVQEDDAPRDSQIAPNEATDSANDASDEPAGSSATDGAPIHTDKEDQLDNSNASIRTPALPGENEGEGLSKLEVNPTG